MDLRCAREKRLNLSWNSRILTQFMEFGYRGGWLTPLIEAMGLHRAGPMKRWLLNHLAFPVKDSHNIVIALGRKRRSGRETEMAAADLRPQRLQSFRQKIR